MRNFVKLTGVLIGCVFSMVTVGASHAAPPNVYRVDLQVLKQSVVVANPIIETRVGKESEMSVTGLDTANDYKLHVKIERIIVENGNKMADVSIKFFEKENSEWKLVFSPKLTSRIGGLAEFSFFEPSSLSSTPDIGFRLRITPVNPALDFALSIPFSNDDDVSVQRKCAPCSGGGQICCSDTCCEDPWSGCPRVCDDGYPN